MTDKHIGYVVTLDSAIHEDDSEFIINAIKAIKHVINVKPVVRDVYKEINETKTKYDLWKKIYEIFYPELKDK